MKRVLMIAFQYPPFAGSSGVQRTLQFSRYLPENGWLPTVLSVHPRAYSERRDDLLGEVPREIAVYRTFGLDAARHLSIAGRYAAVTALPDRWVSWCLSAVPAALRLIRRHAIDVVWSTYPIATAHQIGLTVQRWSKVPWVADFRDPMFDESHPRDPRQRRAYERIEQRTVQRAARVVVTTDGTARLYARRYPDIDRGHVRCIPNGYDEESFAGLSAVATPSAEGPISLLHSGVLYPLERDPTQLFAALAELRDEGKIEARRLTVRLRATAHDAIVRSLIEQHGVGDLVAILPATVHREALAEMMSAHGLLLIQAANCNEQIPAKLYEYLRAGRPVLTLADPAGDTARTMASVGARHIARLESKDEIKRALAEFIAELAAGKLRAIESNRVAQFSRRQQSAQLAQLLDEVDAERRVPAQRASH
jgi:glycosyltransferase involved in cell wall biosynthesis